MDSRSSDHSGQFSLVVGGPFHAILGRLGLIGEDGLPSRLAAISLALLASAALKELEHVQHSPETVWFALAGWIAICPVS